MRAGTRTAGGGIVLWLLASLTQATILAAQEGLFFPFALIGSATYFGFLALLAIPMWRVCRWLSHKQTSTVVITNLIMAVVVLSIWIGAYLGLFRMRFGSLQILDLPRNGLWQ